MFKSNLVLLSTWVGSDMRRTKMMMLVTMLALSLVGVGIVGADGSAIGGPDMPHP